MKAQFDVDDIESVVFGYADDIDGYELISERLSHTDRWFTWMVYVFKFGGKFWEVLWGVGSTEMQESPMWGDTVDATEVEAYEETVTKYRAIEDRTEREEK